MISSRGVDIESDCMIFQGLENLLSEVSDTSEPLIHGTYGYGSQALINLMLTGRAVPYVWDNEQDVGGLSMVDEYYCSGIWQTNTINIFQS